MSTFIYQRALKQLHAAGIFDIVIVRHKGQAWPECYQMPARLQDSRGFPTWQQAVQWVIDGYRPEIIGTSIVAIQRKD